MGIASNSICHIRTLNGIDSEDFDNIIAQIVNFSSETDPIEYLLEVDLSYPAELHDLHNVSLLLQRGQKSIITSSVNTKRNLLASLESQGHKIRSTNKLILDFHDKKNYVIHYMNLKFYMAKGLKLTKIHKIIRFNQKPWLEPYVTLCTNKRKEATSSFEKDFWKLMINSFYGKTIEDKRRHMKADIVTSEIMAEKKIRSNYYDDFFILNSDTAIFKMKNVTVTLDKPVFIGFSVLEKAKHYMYHLHYDVFKSQ